MLKTNWPSSQSIVCSGAKSRNITSEKSNKRKAKITARKNAVKKMEHERLKSLAGWQNWQD